MAAGRSQANTGSRAANNTPIHSIRKHSLKVSIWRNETEHRPMYNVILIRTFRDGEEFKDTNSLGFDDLANAAKLLLDAESWIGEHIASIDRPRASTRAQSGDRER